MAGFPVFVMAQLPNSPMLEEFGWLGLPLPRLQDRFSALASSMQMRRGLPARMSRQMDWPAKKNLPISPPTVPGYPDRPPVLSVACDGYGRRSSATRAAAIVGSSSLPVVCTIRPSARAAHTSDQPSSDFL